MNSDKIALVTGASSGIGAAICARLIEDGYTVYGIGRDFSSCPVFSASFHRLTIDLRETTRLADRLKSLLPVQEISLLVNCAGVAYYGPHETISPEKIHEMLAVNLEAPLILTQMFLRGLKARRGTIVNISSVTASSRNNTHGCAYGATKAALTSFGLSLFEECRKSGVRVVTLQPDLTETSLYRNADFQTAPEEDARLLPDETADALMYLLHLRSGVVVTEMTIRPQKNRICRKELPNSILS